MLKDIYIGLARTQDCAGLYKGGKAERWVKVDYDGLSDLYFA